MNRKLCMLIAAGLIVGVSVFVIGCDMCCNSSKGSGSIVFNDPATSETHKATFSYRVECVGSYSDAEGAVRKVSGHLEYQDHGLWTNAEKNSVRVALHASIDNVVDTSELKAEVVSDYLRKDYWYLEFLPIPGKNDPNAEFYCTKFAPKLALFRGTYRPQPKSLGDGGVVTVMVMDLGKDGPSSDDRFEILLTGGVYDGYKQRGVLAKGDLKAQ